MTRQSASVAVLLVAVVAMTTRAQQQQPPTTVTVNVVGVVSLEEGQPLHISCLVHNLPAWTFVTWSKQTNKGPVKIATNQQLEAAYQGLSTSGRYKMSMGRNEPTTNTVEFIIDITAVKFEDSGNYSCSAPSASVTTHFGIIVTGDPDKPSVSVVDHSNNDNILSIDDGDTLTVIKGGLYDIQYHVSGAAPIPNVTVTAGPWYKQSATPQSTTTPNVVHTVYPGYDAVTYSVLKVHPNVQFDFFVTPRPVTCFTYVSAGNYTSMVKNVTFNVKFADFAPMMQCVQSTVYAMVNQAQAYITCNVTAPVTTKPDFYFSFPPRNLSLHIGDTLQKSPDGTYTADVTFSNDVYVMKLLIVKVPQWSFGSYNFTATNAQGTVSNSVNFVQTTTPQTSPKPAGGKGRGAGVRVEVPMATIVLLALCVFLRP